MFLRIPYEILQSKRAGFEAKIIMAHLLSLKSSGRKFWGYLNWFERWGISDAKAASVFQYLEVNGIIWKDSQMHWDIAELDNIVDWLEAKN